MGKQYDINPDMLYAAAACHDLGLEADRKTHHLESGRIIRALAELRQWFTEDQIETIIRRTVQFGLSHYPDLDKEGHWRRTLDHLHEKYAEGGYLHLLIPGSPNEAPLARLREIIADEELLRSLFEIIYKEETSE